MKLKLLAVIVSFLIFLLVIELVRREKLSFKYALSWIIVSFLALAFSFYENLLFKFASVLGFELPSNFIFFIIGLAFVMVSLVLTVYICQQNNQLQSMAQKVGLLEQEVNRLKKHG